jgi:hypothetical protein
VLIPDGSTVFLLEDVMHTEDILNHPDTQRLIDFDEPVAALSSGSCTRSPTATIPAASCAR